MVTFERIKSNLQDVTSAQIGKCTKIIHNSEDYYLVESETDDLVEYEVHYSNNHGFTCTCPSGQYGFANVSHPSGTCKHCRWAVACFLEQEAAMQELQEKIAEQKAHALALPIVKLSRTEKAMPKWIMDARPSKGMDKAPREI